MEPVPCPSCGCPVVAEDDNEVTAYCAECGYRLFDAPDLVHSAAFAGDPHSLAYSSNNVVAIGSDGSDLLCKSQISTSSRLLSLRRQLQALQVKLALDANVSEAARLVLDKMWAAHARSCGYVGDSVVLVVALFIGSRNVGVPVTLRSLCQDLGPPLSPVLHHYWTVRTSAEYHKPSVEATLKHAMGRFAERRRWPWRLLVQSKGLACRVLNFSRRHVTPSATVWDAAACAVVTLEALLGIPGSRALAADLKLGLDWGVLNSKHIRVLKGHMAEISRSYGIAAPCSFISLHYLEGLLDTDECLAV